MVTRSGAAQRLLPKQDPDLIVRVWVDDWQLECCGDESERGDSVTWNVVRYDAGFNAASLGTELARSIRYAEEHHSQSDAGTPIAGRVEEIRAVHHRFTTMPERPSVTYQVAGSVVLTHVDHADGDHPRLPELQLSGYVVDLRIARADSK